MKALVLAGGTGSRLRPFSYSMPKQLVPVANRPVLFHALDALRAIGVTETGIIIGDSGEAIRGAVGDGGRFGMAVTYLPQEEPRGLAHCVMIARDFLGDDDFVMFLGDNVFSAGLTAPLTDFRERGPAAQLVVSKVADPTAYGVVDMDADGRVLALEEKPAVPSSDLAVTGAYFFTPRIHEAVRSISPSRRGELEITDAIQWLVAAGLDVRARAVAGYWKDTGTPADLLECNEVLLENITPAVRGTVDDTTRIYGPVLIEEGARVTGSVLAGPLIIGAGATVEGSRVGPFASIGAGCRLRDASVLYSILLEDASVDGLHTVHGSIIGKGGEARRGRRVATAHRLMIGDHGQIEVPT